MTRRTSAWALLALLLPAAAGAETPATAAATAGPNPLLTLDGAVRLAVENNRQVQAARLEVEKADADIAIARSRRLPVFETEVSASQLLTPVKFAFPQGAFGTFPSTGPIPAVDTTVRVPQQPTMYVSSQASQPLTQLVRINLGVRMAATTKEIEQEKVRAQRLSIVKSVKQLYFAILQTQSALTANTESIALYRELDRTLGVRVAQQVALRSDSLDVQFKLAQEELARTTYENTLASQKEQLNQLLGRDVRTPFEVQAVSGISALEVDLDAAHRRALANRPDLQEARLTVKQAELDRRLTQADRLPDVSLAISYSSNFNIDVMPTNLASAGVRLTWEPFDWGRRRHELAAKTRTVEQARLSVREFEDRAVVDINTRYRALAEKRATLAVAEMAQVTARERLRVKTNQYRVQAALLPDVLQTRADLADTDDRYQQALLAFWSAKVDFENALGGGIL